MNAFQAPLPTLGRNQLGKKPLGALSPLGPPKTLGSIQDLEPPKKEKAAKKVKKKANMNEKALAPPKDLKPLEKPILGGSKPTSPDEVNDQPKRPLGLGGNSLIIISCLQLNGLWYRERNLVRQRRESCSEIFARERRIHAFSKEGQSFSDLSVQGD